VNTFVTLRRLCTAFLTILVLLLMPSENGAVDADSGSSSVASASVVGVRECGPSDVRLSAGTQGTNETNVVTLVLINSRQEPCALSPPTQLSVVAPGVRRSVEVGKLPKQLNKRLVLGPRRYGWVGLDWGNWCGSTSGVSVQVTFGAVRPSWKAVVEQQRPPICGDSNHPSGVSLTGWGYYGPLASGVYAGVPSFPKGFASQSSIISR